MLTEVGNRLGCRIGYDVIVGGVFGVIIKVCGVDGDVESRASGFISDGEGGGISGEGGIGWVSGLAVAIHGQRDSAPIGGVISDGVKVEVNGFDGDGEG